MTIDDLLIFSCRSGNLELIRERVNQGANIDYKDNDGTTPILTAIKNGHFSIVKALIEKGASVSCVDHHGNNPLDYASEFRNKEIAKLLFENGAYVSNKISPQSKEWFINTIETNR